MAQDSLHDSFTQKAKSTLTHIFAELADGALQTQPNAARKDLKISSLGPDLYDGASGLALFFAAYYRATQDPQAYEAALAALVPVRNRIDRLLASPNARHPGAVDIGGLIGLGSFLYALAATADWLDAPELLQPASALVRIITPELIGADKLLDVMRGSAGTLLGLLHLLRVAKAYGISPGPTLALAIICGEHLLRSRTVSPRADTLGSSQIVSLAGFARGACGISYALAQLYRETRLEQFHDAALEGFAFVRTLYIPERQARLNLSSNQMIEPGSWCFGAPGIALARLGCIPFMDDPTMRHDLENALNISRALPRSPSDQLCCGNFGRIDVLHTAGTVLGRLHLSDLARESSRRILEEVSVSKAFHFAPPIHESHGQIQDSFHSSLFLGLAGVGYTLLRLSYPELIPSVLLFEV
ncbi:MAG TPA: lanthionine synthetase LanC family protein [Candidatus Angelobacter sp.]|nr:lanthionine synthetase LanC family protein [Candidatus Angelobacter sp.]